MSRKAKRKYQAIETMEQGITAYLVINSVLDQFQDHEYPHMKVARFVAKATLNELLHIYLEKNSDEQLQALLLKLNQEASIEGSDAGEVSPPTVPGV